jgi:alanine racemase
MNTPAANTWVELQPDILNSNLKLLRAAIGAGPEIIFVVKSNAYGHGMHMVAVQAWQQGVRWFAVAHMDEAVALRKTLPRARILILGCLRPRHAAEAAHLQLTPVIADRDHAVELASHASSAGVILTVHAKIDTGMGRLGFSWQAAPGMLATLTRLQGLKLEGICTHFASAGDPGSPFAEEQADRFHQALAACHQEGLRFAFRHAANSGAIVRHQGHWDFDGIRPGILLYGYGPAGGKRPIATRPFLQWKTRILQVKRVPAGFPVSYDSTWRAPQETHIATIDVGYADGYMRCMSGKAQVLVGGRRCPTAGRITMNMTAVDVGQLPVKPGDEVVLLGSQGNASIYADELACWADTIPYEILTSIRTSAYQAAPEKIP